MVPGWATGISPGPGREAGQSVTFSVTNDNPGLFTVQPQVQPNGTLTYTPAAACGLGDGDGAGGVLVISNFKNQLRSTF